MTIDLSSLIERVEAGAVGNELDVLIEVALFEPDRWLAAVRPNAAGTKVIYTYRNGREETFWADDWSNLSNRTSTLAHLRALKARNPYHEG